VRFTRTSLTQAAAIVAAAAALSPSVAYADVLPPGPVVAVFGAVLIVVVAAVVAVVVGAVVLLNRLRKRAPGEPPTSEQPASPPSPAEQPGASRTEDRQ